MELTPEQIQKEFEKTRAFLKEKGIIKDNLKNVAEDWKCHFCQFRGTLQETSEHQRKCTKNV